jgi:hypothetical protein
MNIETSNSGTPRKPANARKEQPIAVERKNIEHDYSIFKTEDATHASKHMEETGRGNTAIHIKLASLKIT